MISCTPTAATRIACQLSLNTPENSRKGLRIGVRPSGCSGLSYHLEACDLDNLNADEEIFRSEGIALVVALKDQPFLAGTCLDFEREQMAERLVFKNPNEKARCGCGDSFKV